MELTKERLIIIGSVGLVIVIVAVYALVFSPLIAELGKTYSELKIYETELVRVKRVINSAKKIDTKRVFVTDKALITEEGISEAIAELTRQKKFHGINFVSISPGEIEKQKDARYSIIPITIKAESTYEKLATFLGLLDDRPTAVLTLRSLRIIPNENDADKLESDLVLNLYISTEYGR